jgi:hypothetical protein
MDQPGHSLQYEESKSQAPEESKDIKKKLITEIDSDGSFKVKYIRNKALVVDHADINFSIRDNASEKGEGCSKCSQATILILDPDKKHIE